MLSYTVLKLDIFWDTV